MNETLEYHDFWDTFMIEYLPNKISDEWLVSNEPFIEEIVNAHFRTYELSGISDKVIMRILSETLLECFLHFKDYNTF